MISVAMATYNGEKFIEKQLESFLNQTLLPDEVIICDDRSTDSTVEIIRAFIRKNDLGNKWHIYINNKRLGYIANFVKAIGLTKGEIIFLADQDDVFYKEKFEYMCEFFQKNTDCIVLNAEYEYIDKNGEIKKDLRSITKGKRKNKKKLGFKEIIFESRFPGFSMAIKDVIRNRIKEIDLTFCYGHDQLLLLLGLELDGVYEINKILSGYRIHSANTTGGEKVFNNYNIESRIDQKKNELKEYEKLEKLISRNNIKNINFKFLDVRKHDLVKRISYLENKNLVKIAAMIIWCQSYPKRTILGDLLYILKNK